MHCGDVDLKGMIIHMGNEPDGDEARRLQRIVDWVRKHTDPGQVKLFEHLRWTCNVCGRERPDEAISVHKHDRSAEIGYEPGVFVENIRYCNDNPACVAAAPSIILVSLPTRDETGRST